jgi:uncharacterized protein
MTMRRQRILLQASAVVLLLLLTAPAFSTEVPLLSRRVNDDAGVLSLETVTSLEALLKAHEDSTSNQVAILTITSLEGETIEQFSIRVVDAWKLGQKGKDNGVLLLVSRDDRKVRIEVGKGLEGDLPDITCGSIIRKQILPRFKEGNYDAGVTDGIQAILAAIHGSYVAEEDEGISDDIWGRIFAGGIFLLVVGIFTAIALFTQGGGSWFLYCFLIPFWLAFPLAILGTTGGLTAFGLYAIGFPIIKYWFGKSKTGRSFQQRFAGSTFASSSSGGWSSGSSSSSSSSSSFSGGGGGFSGGGASGSW